MSSLTVLVFITLMLALAILFGVRADKKTTRRVRRTSPAAPRAVVAKSRRKLVPAGASAGR